MNKKSLLFLSLFLLTGCATPVSSSTGGENTSISTSIIEGEVSLQLKVVGEGVVSIFSNGVAITEETFSELEVGADIALYVKAATGYYVGTASFNNEPLSLQNDSAYVKVKAGVNTLNVTFEQAKTLLNDFTLRFDEMSQSFSIVSYKSSNHADPVEVPLEAEHEGKMYPITSIEDSAFFGLEAKEIHLSKNIQSVAADAFLQCRTLERISVDKDSAYYVSHDGVLYSKKNELAAMPYGFNSTAYEIIDGTVGILKGAFLESRITDITCPESLKTIGDEAFLRSRISNITFQGGIESIGSSTFKNCSSLRHIDLTGLISMGSEAFYSTGLTEIDIPSTLKEVSTNAFYFNFKLQKITLHEGLETIGIQAFCGSPIISIAFPSTLKNIKESAFALCQDLVTVEFNEGLETIDSLAFDRAAKIRSINLPSTITYIGENNPFAGVTLIGSTEDNFTIEENDKYKIIDRVLYELDGSKKTLITYPYGYAEAEFVIPSDVSHLATNSFNFNKELSKITIPTSVVSISSAFKSFEKPLELVYLGTMEQFKAIDLHPENGMEGGSGSWAYNTTIKDGVIHCTDGDLAVSSL